jgi:hypothetical protein
VNKQHDILPSSPVDVFFGLATQEGDALFTQDWDLLGFEGIAFIDSKEYVPTLVSKQSNRSLTSKTYKPSLTSKKIDYTLNLKTYVFEQNNKQRNITQSAKSYVPTIQAKQNTPTISAKSYTPGLSETIIQDTFDFLITQDLAYLTTQDGDYIGFDKKFIGYLLSQNNDFLRTQDGNFLEL